LTLNGFKIYTINQSEKFKRTIENVILWTLIAFGEGGQTQAMKLQANKACNTKAMVV
jgi:hypothetical protein